MSLSRFAYKPGDIIQGNSQPLFKVINVLSQKGKICDGCFKSCSVLKTCAGCNHMHYCSKTCQSADWKSGHKLECTSKAWNNNFSQRTTVEFRCQLFRALAFLKMDPEIGSKPFLLYNGKTRCANDLLSHQESFVSSKFHPVCAKLAAEILEENLDTGGIVADTKFFLKIAGILQTNAFSIYTEDQTARLGLGVYVEPSVFNHSCKPTAMYCSKGSTVDVKAIAFIPEGKEPTISYIACHAGRAERQRILKERYNFDCLCERCVENPDAPVDFNQLNSNIEFFGYCEVMPHIASAYPIGNLLDRHEQTIKWMKLMYNEYDERVTNQYERTVLTLLMQRNSMYNPRAKNLIATLIEETKDHLKITCGEDHPDYAKLERAVRAAGFN